MPTPVDATETEAAVPASPSIPPPAHHIVQTLLGPDCLKCESKGGRTERAFLCVCRDNPSTLEEEEMPRSGRPPNARALVRELNSQLVGMHERIAADESSLEALVSTELSIETEIHHTSFCNKCGYVDKLCRLKTHAGSKLNKCTLLNIEHGRVYVTTFGFKVPQRFLQGIVAGTFRVPYRRTPECQSLYCRVQPLAPELVPWYKLWHLTFTNKITASFFCGFRSAPKKRQPSPKSYLEKLDSASRTRWPPPTTHGTALSAAIHLHPPPFNCSPPRAPKSHPPPSDPRRSLNIGATTANEGTIVISGSSRFD